MEKQRGANSACLNCQSSSDSAVSPHYTEASDIVNRHQFFLQEGYRPPTSLKKFFSPSSRGMAFILVFDCICEFLQNHPCSALRIASNGQIVGVSSYHVHLLTGKVGQSDQQFYFMATKYISTSVLWWVLFRMFKSVYVLALPFLFYRLAFLVLGLANNAKTIIVRDWVEKTATAFYSIASSSYWV